MVMKRKVELDEKEDNKGRRKGQSDSRLRKGGKRRIAAFGSPSELLPKKEPNRELLNYLKHEIQFRIQFSPSGFFKKKYVLYTISAFFPGLLKDA